MSQRDIRLYRYEVNMVIEREGQRYRVRRILKVGFDEYLLYLRAEPIEAPAAENELAPDTSEPVEDGVG